MRLYVRLALWLLVFTGIVLGFFLVSKAYTFAPKLDVHANEEALKRGAAFQMQQESHARKRIKEAKDREESEKKRKEEREERQREEIRRKEGQAQISRQRYEENFKK